MSYRIKNTALDHTKRFLHRRAHKMQMEPVLAGRRLRLRTSMVISDELFEHNKANLELYKRWGVVEWEQLGGDGKPAMKDPSGELPVLAPEDKTPVPAQKAVEVVLVDVGESPIAVLKVLREMTSMDLKEANDLLGMVPVVVSRAASELAAVELEKALLGAGAKTEIKWVSASPPAETTPKETKPQPKSPFKGKKQ